MAIDLAYTLIRDVFLDTIIFNINWGISIVITLLCLLLITRDHNKWKELAFPVMVGLHIAGIPPFILIYVACAIMFGIETLSLQTIGQLLNAVKIPVQFNEQKEKIKDFKSLQSQVKFEKRKRDLKNLPTEYLDEALARGKGKVPPPQL